MTRTFCLSIDIDWAHDEVILDCLEVIEAAGVAATWFITHDTPVLGRIRASGRHELGLHPNFNHLLEGESGNAMEVIAQLRNVVPESRCVRSHSLARSSRIAGVCRQAGITHESNFLIPPHVAPELAPWRDFCGIVQVPIRWEDDVRLADPTLGEPADHLEHNACFVVDFHPIHVFLNTTSMEDYERARPDMRNPVMLRRLRRTAGAGGTRDRLVALLARARELGLPSRRMSILQPESEAR